MLNRRDLIAMGGSSAIVCALFEKVLDGLIRAESQKSTTETQEPSSRRTIAMLVYPGFTALDLVGPHHVFSALQGYAVHTVWKSKEPVSSDSGLIVTPTLSFDECPEELAILFVPGGTMGTVRAMEDADVMAFLQSRGEQADYVTSVCTGALVLGAAGLLKGYKATTHWSSLDLLKLMGAEPVSERVVEDRNRFTGGGVTAGIDFGLTLAAKIEDETFARNVQLVMEYSPQPPFTSGTPAEAGKEMTDLTVRRFSRFLNAAEKAAKNSAQQQ